MEVVRSVPSGGNWRNLPATTIAKSARLTQISNSGGRTTYYGRLDGNLPSYTINTYFNRPGNGTFIHPSQNRLISLREAARLQSFSDDYRFLGSLSSRFKQIGNAVPPLLSMAIGEKIKVGRCVDLFCGAGGLSTGLAQAGHRIIVATDFNEHMCETYRYNHEKTHVVQANMFVQDELVHLLDVIELNLKGRTLNLLAGGPPCQGFSTAGKWSSSDTRNSLIFRTLEFVKKLAPETVLLENVPGIRSLQQGKILDLLLDALGAEGYHPQILLLKAEEYGIPQRRRRIFILGSRSGDLIEKPEELFSEVVQGRTRKHKKKEHDGLPPPISVSEAISDLPKIPSGGGIDTIEYDYSWMKSDYQKYMRGVISLEDLLSKRTK
ncbi:MAG: DNA (cytosine-5-)-methyltransferase [Candidatus Odinarchaeota archaeon]